MLIVSMLLGTLSYGGVQLPQNVVQTQTSSVLTPPPEEDPDTWTEQLLLLLQIMCVIMNCNNSSATSSAGDAVNTWVNTYEQKGLKTGLGGLSSETVRSQIVVLKYWADRDPGVLTATQRSAFINSLYAIDAEISK